MVAIFNKLIINSKKYGKFEVLFDETDFDLISKYTWHINKARNGYYASTNLIIEEKYTTRRMHQILTNFKLVDHINGNGLDNRRENLREANYSQNSANTGKRSIMKTSKYKGVYFYKGAYVATISPNYKTKYLGRFKTEIEAAKAYNEAAIKYFGEYASLNKL